MGSCKICGADLGDDLFSAVTHSALCSICTVNFMRGQHSTPERIEAARKYLGLKAGKFLKQDSGEEARRILGR